MSFLDSVRDAALVARWWLERAVRTRSAAALVLVYTLVAAGGAWIFTKVLLQMEQVAARSLAVPTTDKPGAMLDTLRERGELQEVLEGLIGDPTMAAWALDLPILSVYTFWLGLGTVPFLAAAAGAEAIAPDIRDRSLRYELVRTGRLELIAGRFAGQALLVGLGLAVGCVGVWVVAMTAMVEQPPVEQATTLALFAPRMWVWSLPFLGLGIAFSQITSNVNFARTLALAGVVGTWTAWGITHEYVSDNVPWLGDLLLPLFAPNYCGGLWGPGWAWLEQGLILCVLGFVTVLLTFPLFKRRNA